MMELTRLRDGELRRIDALINASQESEQRMEEQLTGGRIIRPAYKAVAKRREYTNLNDR